VKENTVKGKNCQDAAEDIVIYNSRLLNLSFSEVND
jgi:hypothetical protein